MRSPLILLFSRLIPPQYLLSLVQSPPAAGALLPSQAVPEEQGHSPNRQYKELDELSGLGGLLTGFCRNPRSPAQALTANTGA